MNGKGLLLRAGLLRAALVFLLVCLLGEIAGCGGGSASTNEPTTPAPSNLSYPQSSITAVAGQAIAADTPSVSGTVTSYSVSPALPTGLSLNASTGVISGTAVSATVQASFTVTATNGEGSASTTVQIVVDPAPPTSLVYPQSTIAGVVGQPIAGDLPSVTGSVAAFTVSPALPAGLSLNAGTGAIAGTPTGVVAQSSYTVTASNVSGSATAVVMIAVNPAGPASLSYPQSTIAAIVGQAIAADTPTVTGSVTSYSVMPALPAGLSLSAATGAIAGTPTAVVAQASYTVTASNASGSATAVVQVAVNPAAPTSLSYPVSTVMAVVGQVLVADVPTVTGTVSSYSVSPALPAGLSLNAATGAIAGTPTAVAAQASYTVTASNASGSATAAVQIVVNPAAPTNLVYPVGTVTATMGQAIAVDTPTVVGSVTNYNVMPALPAGLSLNAVTGAISGTASSVTAQASYTVTASNVSGSATAVVQIAVNPGPPVNLVYPQASITAYVNGAITTDVPSVTGTVTSYTVSPALPAGLSLDPVSGAISGTPTAASAQATYTVTATNTAGSTTANVTITVNSFSPFSLVDLGHTNPVSVLRLQSSRLFSQDGGGHWALWNYTTGAELASGEAIATGTTDDPYPADAAGSVVAIGIANAVEIRSSTDGSLITTLSSPSLDPLAASAWWKLATDGSYVAAGYGAGLFVWSTTDGHLMFSRTGNYAQATAYAAPGQVQIALGPAGSNVIETDSVPGGTSSTGPAFSGTFNAWFSDGSHFVTNSADLNPAGVPPSYQVYVYSTDSVQQNLLTVGTVGTFGGYANWFWIYGTSSTLDLYPVGATSPVATYTVNSIPLVVASGSTLGVFQYGAGAGFLVDLSGTSPSVTNVTLPVAYESAFAAISPATWVVGNRHGVVLDGGSLSGSARYFGYGNVFSMSGAAGQVAMATASGKILTFVPGSQTAGGAINFSSSKIMLSADGTVLAAKANDLDSQYEPDRTLNVYALPAGTLMYSYPSQYVSLSTAPFLFDFTMSGAGNALGQLIGTYNGLYFDYTREVTPLSGSPFIWSDHPASGVYNGTDALFLSPDGTLIAASSGDYTATSTAGIYRNGALVATVNGVAVGWIDNNRLLVNTFSSSGTYTGTMIYDASGTLLATLNSLPQLAPSQSGSGSVGGFLTVDSNSIYSPGTVSIYSLSTGAAIWAETLPHGGTSYNAPGASTISGSYVVFVSGARVVVDLP